MKHFIYFIHIYRRSYENQSAPSSNDDITTLQQLRLLSCRRNLPLALLLPLSTRPFWPFRSEAARNCFRAGRLLPVAYVPSSNCRDIRSGTQCHNGCRKRVSSDYTMNAYNIYVHRLWENAQATSSYIYVCTVRRGRNRLTELTGYRIPTQTRPNLIRKLSRCAARWRQARRVTAHESFVQLVSVRWRSMVFFWGGGGWGVCLDI